MLKKKENASVLIKVSLINWKNLKKINNNKYSKINNKVIYKNNKLLQFNKCNYRIKFKLLYKIIKISKKIHFLIKMNNNDFFLLINLI